MHVSNYFYIEHRGEVAALLSKLANDDLAGAGVLARAIAEGDAEAVRAAAAPQEGEQVWKTFFSNSGAEANECSMKLARLYAKRCGNGGNTIVCLRGGFHGRTLETLAATMQNRLQDTFRPLPGGFVACTPNDIDELREVFAQLEGEICAVMLEPFRVKAACTRSMRHSSKRRRALCTRWAACSSPTRFRRACSAQGSRSQSSTRTWCRIS